MVLAAAAIFSIAQDIDAIKDLMAKQQWDKAKEAIDKFAANEKNSKKWETWYFKAHIYNNLSKDEKLKSLVTNPKQEAFNAYKKYLETDPKMIQGLMEQNVLLFDLYNSYFDEAAKSFDKKDFDNAYTHFKNALMIEEFVVSKDFSYSGFTFPPFDTALIQNIAVSAMNAKKEEEAVGWYQKIADKKIAGEDYKSIYEYLVQYYDKKKDMTNREKYLVVGRELYPNNDFWVEIELNEVDPKDKLKLFSKYEELNAKYPGRYLMHYNYSVELYNYTYTGDTKPANYAEMQAKLESVLKKTIELNPTPEANLLMSRHYYMVIYDLQDAQKLIRGTKPEDLKKRNDIKTQMLKKADEMIPYAQHAYDSYNAKTSLRPIEKGNFKIAADYLASAYELKGMKTKAEEYSKKRDSIQ